MALFNVDEIGNCWRNPRAKAGRPYVRQRSRRSRRSAGLNFVRSPLSHRCSAVDADVYAFEQSREERANTSVTPRDIFQRLNE